MPNARVLHGPLRLASLECPKYNLSLRDAGLNLDARIDRNLAGLEGNAGLTGGMLSLAESRVETLTGSSSFSWRKSALTAKYRLGTGQVRTPNAESGVILDRWFGAFAKRL